MSPHDAHVHALCGEITMIRLGPRGRSTTGSGMSRRAIATRRYFCGATQCTQLIDVEIPADGEALVQHEGGQHVDPIAKGPRLDIEPIVAAEERVVQR